MTKERRSDLYSELEPEDWNAIVTALHDWCDHATNDDHFEAREKLTKRLESALDQRDCPICGGDDCQCVEAASDYVDDQNQLASGDSESWECRCLCHDEWSRRGKTEEYGRAPFDLVTYLEKDLEDRRAEGEDCPTCGGDRTIETNPAGAGHADDLAEYVPCPDCNGSGKSRYITQAEGALKAARGLVERERKMQKILDDHTDYEGPMPETGDYIGGVDPGALDLIVDLLRPKR